MHSKLLGGGESARARAVMMMDCSLLVFPLSQYTYSLQVRKSRRRQKEICISPFKHIFIARSVRCHE